MEPLKHILFLPTNMWGHTRPMCTLATRCVRLRPVSITLFVAASLSERAHAEIVADFLQSEERLLPRIKLVALTQGDQSVSGAVYEDAFLAAWETLQAGDVLEAQSVGLAADGTLVLSQTSVNLHTAPLAAALIDMFMIRAFRTLRTAHPTRGRTEKLPLYTWMPAAPNCMAALFAEDRVPAVEALVARTGVSFDEAAHQILMSCEGRLVECSYLPPMYDYELHPQGAPIPPEFCGEVVIHVPSALRDADGLVAMAAAEYHPGATQALRTMFEPRPVVFAGPLVARRKGSIAALDSDVAAFLDMQLDTRGERTVLLISFGSTFWPSDPAKLEAVLDVLVDADVPFVMSCASPFATLSDELKGRLAVYKGAFLSDWVPQQAVLEHSATGWCMTHAGHNSSLECILAGVPMILWPVDADQTPNAVHLSVNLDIACELLEVRHGAGIGPIYRTGHVPSGTLDAVRAELCMVLALASGEDGKKKRLALRVLREQLGRAWSDGEEGVARREVEAFLDRL